MRSDFRASNSYQVHLLNAKERVTVKTYIPKVKTRNITENGVKKNSYEGIIREYERTPSEVLNSFNNKFLSQTAHSSQMRQQKGNFVYDVGHLPTSCQTHKPVDPTKWQQKPLVPTPCYVAGSKFTKKAQKPIFDE